MKLKSHYQHIFAFKKLVRNTPQLLVTFTDVNLIA